MTILFRKLFKIHMRKHFKLQTNEQTFLEITKFQLTTTLQFSVI